MTSHAIYNLKTNPTKIYIFLWICIYGIFIFPSSRIECHIIKDSRQVWEQGDNRMQSKLISKIP